MILANTVATTVTLNGVASTVNTPADQMAPRGFGASSNGSDWVALPGPTVAAVAVATPASAGTATFDWSLGGYFTWTPYGGSCTVAFTNVTIGQIIFIRTTHATSAAVTLPTTFTWYTGSGGAAPAFTTKDSIIMVICTGANTYDAATIAIQT
jgi:hypothetical protein